MRMRNAIDKFLQKEYYNLKSSGSYFGPSKLRESLKAFLNKLYKRVANVKNLELIKEVNLQIECYKSI